MDGLMMFAYLKVLYILYCIFESTFDRHSSVVVTIEFGVFAAYCTVVHFYGLYVLVLSTIQIYDAHKCKYFMLYVPKLDYYSFIMFGLVWLRRYPHSVYIQYVWH